MGRASLWLGRKSEMGDEMRSRKLFLHGCRMSCIAKQGRITRAMLWKWKVMRSMKPVRMGLSMQRGVPCHNPSIQEAKAHTNTCTTHRNLLLHNRFYWVDTQQMSECYRKEQYSTSVYFSSTDAYRQITHTQQKNHTIYLKCDNKRVRKYYLVGYFWPENIIMCMCINRLKLHQKKSIYSFNNP